MVVFIESRDSSILTASNCRGGGWCATVELPSHRHEGSSTGKLSRLSVRSKQMSVAIQESIFVIRYYLPREAAILVIEHLILNFDKCFILNI